MHAVSVQGEHGGGFQGVAAASGLSHVIFLLLLGISGESPR
jgi:hypothetical protein